MKKIVLIAAMLSLSTTAFAGVYDSEPGTPAYSLSNGALIARNTADAGTGPNWTDVDKSVKFQNGTLVRINLRACCDGKVPDYVLGGP